MIKKFPLFRSEWKKRTTSVGSVQFPQFYTTDVTNCLYNCLVNEYTDTVNEGNDFLYRVPLKRGGDGSG